MGYLSCVIPGTSVSGTVSVATQVVLGTSQRRTNPLAPHLAGSILWEERGEIRLNSGPSRFPVEWLDFGATSWLPPDSGWFLECPIDKPQAPALACLRLYVNSSHAAVRSALTTFPPRIDQAAIQETIEFDVARSLLETAFAAEDFGVDSDFEPGSIGSVVMALVSELFPSESFEALRARHRMNPQRFEVLLQGALRLFRSLPT